ncbi:MAG: hypothetical protein J7530_08005 [Novosphingobium sp.]|nr:hypothetical protein [Novosphingobium sp.]
MSEERLEAIAQLVVHLAAQQSVLHDAMASLFAEVANLSPEAGKKLEEMISSEEGAAFAAFEDADLTIAAMPGFQKNKEHYRETLFAQARGALVRIRSRSS